MATSSQALENNGTAIRSPDHVRTLSPSTIGETVRKVLAVRGRIIRSVVVCATLGGGLGGVTKLCMGAGVKAIVLRSGGISETNIDKVVPTISYIQRGIVMGAALGLMVGIIKARADIRDQEPEDREPEDREPEDRRCPTPQ